MAENSEYQTTRHHKGWIVFGVMAPMCYVLSSGPVMWLFNRQPTTEFLEDEIKPIIIAFYQPLNWVCDYLPRLGNLLCWYWDLA